MTQRGLNSEPRRCATPAGVGAAAVSALGLALLAAELGDPRALDEMVHRPNGGRMRAFGARLAFHVGAGTVPLDDRQPALLRPSAVAVGDDRVGDLQAAGKGVHTADVGVEQIRGLERAAPHLGVKVQAAVLQAVLLEQDAQRCAKSLLESNVLHHILLPSLPPNPWLHFLLTP